MDVSKFERSDARIDETTARPSERQPQPEPVPVNGQGRHGTGTGYASIREVVEQRRRTLVATAPRQKGRPPGSVEEREQLAAFLTDFGRELGDEAPLASTITRVLNIFKAAGVPAERWGDAMYQARAATQERTAQITKRAEGGASGTRRKNKMPYFIACLEQAAGLRGATPGTAAGRRPGDRRSDEVQP